MELLERETALADVEAALAEAAAGEGRVVLLAGEAGVGKTRLVEALAERGGRPHAHAAGGLRSAAHPPGPRPGPRHRPRGGRRAGGRARLGRPARDGGRRRAGRAGRGPPAARHGDRGRPLGRRGHARPARACWGGGSAGTTGTLRRDLPQRRGGARPARGGGPAAAGPGAPHRPGAALAGGGRRAGPPRGSAAARSSTAPRAATRSSSPRCWRAAAEEVAPRTVRDAVLARAARLGAGGARGDRAGLRGARARRAVARRGRPRRPRARTSRRAWPPGCWSSTARRCGSGTRSRGPASRRSCRRCAGASWTARVLAALLDRRRGSTRPAWCTTRGAPATATPSWPTPPRRRARPAPRGPTSRRPSTTAPRSRVADDAEPETRAELLEGLSFESYLSGPPEESLATRREALAIRTRLGQTARVGEDERWLARMLWWTGPGRGGGGGGAARHRAARAARAAAELAMAYSGMSQLMMLVVADRGRDRMGRPGDRAGPRARPRREPRPRPDQRRDRPRTRTATRAATTCSRRPSRSRWPRASTTTPPGPW